MKHPAGAQFYRTTLDGKAICKYYRYEEVKYNDETVGQELMYLSEQGVWMNCALEDTSVLIPIIRE